MVIENDLSKYVKKNSVNGIIDYYQLYNEIDYIDKNCHLKNYIKFFNKDGKGKKWLDIGCNVGKSLKLIKDRNYDEYGFDIVEKSIKIAKEGGFKAIIHNIIDEFPYSDDFFDVVSATDVLEHLTKNDIDFCIDQIKRVLKPNGLCLLASCPHDDRYHVHVTIQSIDEWEKLYNFKGFATIKRLRPYSIVLCNDK